MGPLPAAIRYRYFRSHPLPCDYRRRLLGGRSNRNYPGRSGAVYAGHRPEDGSSRGKASTRARIMAKARLDGKVIVVGVTGGVAAVKTAHLVTGLRKLGAEVHVVMTAGGPQLFAAPTFSAPSPN